MVESIVKNVLKGKYATSTAASIIVWWYHTKRDDTKHDDTKHDDTMIIPNLPDRIYSILRIGYFSKIMTLNQLMHAIEINSLIESRYLIHIGWMCY